MAKKSLKISNIHTSVACNLDPALLQACLPLLQSGHVDAIEWSWDVLYAQKTALPDWFEELLLEFAKAKRLVGHGVFYSMFSGKWSVEQDEWLRNLAHHAQRFDFQHITEHFGFFTGPDFHSGAPISVPFSDRTLRIGRDRLARMQDAAQCPVGIENLAIAYSINDVKRHGAFLDALVEPLNGFLLLDLHNLYCHVHNFKLDFLAILGAYPLHRVREIHISGGSWEKIESAPNTLVRRDTHNERVPEVVFEMLKSTIPLCPNLKFVVLEQLGNALGTPKQQVGFQADFQIMRNIVNQSERRSLPVSDFMPTQKRNLADPIPEDLSLYAEQMQLSALLENTKNLDEIEDQLKKSILANTDWQIEQWPLEMIETCMQIAQKWQNQKKIVS
jgi:uncharacterized protein